VANEGIRRRLDSVTLVVLIVALCYGTFLALLLRHRGGDPSIFVVAAGPGVDAARVPPGLTVRKDIGGYDGAAFYRLALDPFTRLETAYGITLDNPSYRQQRIGYPLLVYCLALGHPSWVPTLLVAVNAAALLVLGALGGLLARRAGCHALWGLVVPFYPGFLLSLSRDLSEIVACAFALAAILAIQSRRSVAGGLLLSAAVLTRESFLIVVAALAAVFMVTAIRRRLPRLAEPASFAIPLAIYALWQWWLWTVWGVAPVRAGAPHLTLPFVEYARFLAASSSLRGVARLNFSEASFFAVVTLVIAAGWRSSRSLAAWRTAWVAWLALASTLPHPVWYEDVGFVRVLADFYLLSTVLVMDTGRIGRVVLAVSTFVLWYYLAGHLVKYG
jgi:hypothetical protein